MYAQQGDILERWPQEQEECLQPGILGVTKILPQDTKSSLDGNQLCLSLENHNEAGYTRDAKALLHLPLVVGCIGL